MMTSAERLSMMAGRTESMRLPDGSAVDVIWTRNSSDQIGVRGSRVSIQGTPADLADLVVGDVVLHVTTLRRYRVEDLIFETTAGGSVIAHLHDEDEPA